MAAFAKKVKRENRGKYEVSKKGSTETNDNGWRRMLEVKKIIVLLRILNLRKN